MALMAVNREPAGHWWQHCDATCPSRGQGRAGNKLERANTQEACLASLRVLPQSVDTGARPASLPHTTGLGRGHATEGPLPHTAVPVQHNAFTTHALQTARSVWIDVSLAHDSNTCDV
jgi:hypothetical protein